MLHKSVAVIGLGYVGLPLALLAAKKNYHVVGIDADARKVKKINQKISPIGDDSIADELRQTDVRATTEFADVVDVETIIVCVPTPVDHNCFPDLTPVKDACEGIAQFLTDGQLVIIESTINPGVCEEVVLPILEANGAKCGVDFYLAHCPERINPGDAKWNVSNIPRVVGGYDAPSLTKATTFYQSILSAAVKPMDSLREAEAVKVVENSFRDINIAFVNELAMSFSKLGIDVVNVIDGAATKPFSFMAHYPGAGVGGHCIPVDPYYLIEYAKQNGFEHTFLKAARKINKAMPKFAVDQLLTAMDAAGVTKPRVLVLGLSYKPNIGDLRESPSLEIIRLLRAQNLEVVAYDPYVEDVDAADCEVSTNLDEALSSAEAVLLATAHKEFLQLKPGDLYQRGVKVIVDGRNCLDKSSYQDSPLVYSGIGR